VKLENLSHKTWLIVSTIIAKWLKRNPQQNTITNKDQSQRWHGGYPVVRPRPTLAYSMLWRPNGRGLQSTPLKRSKDPLEYHGVLFSFHYPVCKESPQIGVSCPYKYMITNETQSKGGKQHTQIHSKSAHTRPRIELTRLSQSSHLEQSSNHLETQTNAQRLSVDDQECSKVACVSPPCA